MKLLTILESELYNTKFEPFSIHSLVKSKVCWCTNVGIPFDLLLSIIYLTAFLYSGWSYWSGIPNEIVRSLGPTNTASIPLTDKILSRLFIAGTLSIPIIHILFLFLFSKYNLSLH